MSAIESYRSRTGAALVIAVLLLGGCSGRDTATAESVAAAREAAARAEKAADRAEEIAKSLRSEPNQAAAEEEPEEPAEEETEEESTEPAEPGSAQTNSEN